MISISIAAITRYSAASSRFFAAHDLDVLQVLARERRHRDVEDVEVFLADQVEQQVERALEGLEEDLERVGRDVEVVRQLDDRLAVELGDGDGSGADAARRQSDNPMASRTSRMVSAARRFALVAAVGDDVFDQRRVVEIGLRARSRIGASSR